MMSVRDSWVFPIFVLVLVVVVSLPVYAQFIIRPISVNRIEIIECCTQGVFGGPDSQCSYTHSIESCREKGGSVQNQCGDFVGGGDVNYQVTNLTQYPGNWSGIDIETDSILSNLTDAIRSLKVYDTKYNKSSYNCVNFASDLEVGLTSLGFNATITFLRRHAITDVHIGTHTIFVEPQINASRKYNGTSYTYWIPYVSLDYNKTNGVSQVGVLDNPNPYPKHEVKTEGGRMVYIFESLKKAIENGFKNKK